MGTIVNGNNVPLSQSMSGMPDVSDALKGYFIPMTFTTTVKKIVNQNLVETPTSTAFRGVWQPLTVRSVNQKPEGQRSWRWFMCHSDTCLHLETDQVIFYNGIQYRVKAEKDYSLNGYWYYEMIQDFTGSGP